MDLDQQLRVEMRGRERWLTIDREARRNAIDGAVIETMRKALTAFEQSAAFAESRIGPFALTDHAREGQSALRDKRRPQWRGR